MIISDIQQQKYNKSKYSIFVDHKYSFSLEDIDLLKLGLKIGQLISNEQLNLFIQTYELTKAKEKALNFISFKQRTSSEVRKKLKNAEYCDSTIDAIISYLTENNYLDDEKYAEMFIKDQIKFKSSSARAIKQKLAQKGVNSNIAIKKIEDAGIDEYALALELVNKKAAKINIMDKKDLSRLYGMLIRKGFSNDIALKAIRTLSDNG